MKVAGTFITGETDAAKLPIQATSFSPSSLLLSPPASAGRGDADTDVLPLGCSCWHVAQLLLLPPRWEDGGGEEKEEENCCCFSGCPENCEGCREVKNWAERLWLKGNASEGGVLWQSTKKINFTWHLQFLQTSEEKQQSADTLLILHCFSRNSSDIFPATVVVRYIEMENTCYFSDQRTQTNTFFLKENKTVFMWIK